LIQRQKEKGDPQALQEARRGKLREARGVNDAVAIAAVRNRSLPPRSGGYSGAAAGRAGSDMERII
jgi:hypothetical protein